MLPLFEIANDLYQLRLYFVSSLREALAVNRVCILSLLSFTLSSAYSNAQNQIELPDHITQRFGLDPEVPCGPLSEIHGGSRNG